MTNNRRDHFRIPVYDKGCVVKDNFKTSLAESREVSAGGMSLLVNYDVFNEFVEVEFKIREMKFKRFARVLRRKRESSGKTLYSLQFLNYTEQERAALSGALMNLSVLKR